MKRTIIEKNLRETLASQGVTLQPGGRAERGVKLIASVSAEVTTTGERALRNTRNAINLAAENARDAMHQATRPRKRRK